MRVVAVALILAAWLGICPDTAAKGTPPLAKSAKYAAYLRHEEAVKAHRAALKRKREAQKRRAAQQRYRATHPVAQGKYLAAQRGWTGAQWLALYRLWCRESGWRVTASNPSGAYGIPQACPGSKMASFGSDWRTCAKTQIRWGLSYIAARWKTPSAALANSYAHGWY